MSPIRYLRDEAQSLVRQTGLVRSDLTDGVLAGGKGYASRRSDPLNDTFRRRLLYLSQAIYSETSPEQPGAGRKCSTNGPSAIMPMNWTGMSRVREHVGRVARPFGNQARPERARVDGRPQSRTTAAYSDTRHVCARTERASETPRLGREGAASECDLLAHRSSSTCRGAAITSPELSRHPSLRSRAPRLLEVETRALAFSSACSPTRTKSTSRLDVTSARHGRFRNVQRTLALPSQ
jgi:hypothetical protein